MQLQYKQEHLQCRYYATEHTALFRMWDFAAGDVLPEFNKEHTVFLYLSGGSVEIFRGGRNESIAEKQLLVLPHESSFYGKATEDTCLWTCITPGHIPMCSRYDITNLQQDIKTLKGKAFTPPPYRKNHCKSTYYRLLPDAWGAVVGRIELHSFP